ncbi:MAG: DNA recombination protein RmuC [Candidatus Aenigmarchaeota archaeon]|nr:DNA recombination protein RmuC [Candidatus Aenigmarchaeota archaeon]
MNYFFIIISGLILFLLIYLIVLLSRKGSDEGLKDRIIRLDEKIAQLNQKSGEISQTLDQKLSESARLAQLQSNQNTQIVRQVTEQLTKLGETSRQVIDFAGQLQSLQDVLSNPKQRGILGEYYLETVLKDVLPPDNYQMQYSFGRDSESGKNLIVDAVVFVKDKIIPIDSKFSLENYNRIINEHNKDKRQQLEKLFRQDLKKRIDETAKYILPEKKTYDFAFMFIPSEAIFYDLLINKVGEVKTDTRSLIEYAFRDKHVIIVSPTTFLAYLQMVLQGLKALQIEESAKEIKKNIIRLGKHLNSYDNFLQKLGGHLGTTVNTYNTAYQEFKKIDKDILKITKGESKIEPKTLDKPKL